MSATILIVDDEPDIREMIGEILADEDFRPVLAADADQARQLREAHDPDLILLDVWMPGTDGISLLREWRGESAAMCPVVMISGHGTVEAAVEATRFGACDFIEKPVSIARLLTTVKKALAEAAEPAAGNAERQDEIPPPLGRSAAMQKLIERLERIGAGSANVMITGERGTGRSTLARWLHANGPGAGMALIETGCGPASQAFDGALDQTRRDTVLVLDRIEAITDDQATRLARRLDERGGAARVIAIGLPGLEQQAAAGHFDNALFHRLAESRLEVPPLRERRDDIPELVRYLTDQLPGRENLPYRAIPVPAQNLLRQYDWPGNLRELVNLVRQLLQAGDEQPVGLEEVQALLERSAADNIQAIETVHSPLFELPLREAREAFERQYLLSRLKRAGGSVGVLAEAVEMERTHLYRKLRQLGIDPKQVQEDT